MCFFILFLILATINFQENTAIDYGFYKYSLGNDAWRVLYLRGGLHNFDKAKLNSDLERITELTSLCFYFEEEDVASCISEQDTLVLKKMAYINGQAKEITMHVGTKQN
ncbi:hypothetical protein HZC08_01305 [Candidatus Micrarchaeota archaeon]|nr:hypothetical protein [Candidatus Micrarchaeota archaeon]